MMPEYKDVSSLKKEIADFKKCMNSPNSDYLTGYLCALSVTEGMIASLPDVDVVEVVRCKDCKHYRNWEDGNMTCSLWTVDWDVSTTPNAFCSYGERKEKGENPLDNLFGDIFRGYKL